MNKKAKLNTTELLITTALLTALATSIMLFVRIPLFIGYIHLGDVVIFCAALLLPFRLALFVGGISGMLADLLGAYPQYAVFSLFIKMAIVLMVRIFRKQMEGKHRIFTIAFINLVAVILYALTNLFLLNLAGALEGIPFDLIQATATTVIVIFIYSRLILLKPYFKGALDETGKY